MNISVQLYNRYDQPLTVAPEIDWQIERITWAAIGGSNIAEIIGFGQDNYLVTLLDQLGNNIRIYDEYANFFWIGYVHGVEVVIGGIQLDISLGGMFNSVQVIYNRPNESARIQTTWYQDNISIERYGIKEQRYNLNDVSDAAAQAYAQQILSKYRYPVANYKVNHTRTARNFVRLMCRGLWNKLNWRFYQNNSTNNAETSQQIRDILSAANIFTNIVVDTESGITTPVYRDGNQTMLAYIESLMKIGNTANKRYLSRVDAERGVIIYTEPEVDDNDWLIDQDWNITTSLGIPVDYPTPGRWLRVKPLSNYDSDVILLNSGRLFVEEVEYSGYSGQWQIYERRESLMSLEADS